MGRSAGPTGCFEVATALLGLGSNLGDRRRNLLDALDLLHSREVRVHALSGCYRSDPVGNPDQPMFLNAVCRVATALPPRSLLERCLEVERRMGRVRRKRWEPRIIDLDLLYFDQFSIREPDLKIPHPRLHERRFVLVPLAELCPAWIDPRHGCTALELLQRCSDRSRVIADLEV